MIQLGIRSTGRAEYRNRQPRLCRGNGGRLWGASGGFGGWPTTASGAAHQGACGATFRVSEKNLKVSRET
ncbi:hypothetical protein EPI10_010505 [Gossypium australe]|uniref:Uncharacterized protein n=1 Tax=Gossypium australe TaxID=47621 RepID=A0A5B6W5Q1_9ROSI|nr:hypothetical protein EPI10_010505 [Gossypium australe]